jgi:hypothetical protein
MNKITGWLLAKFPDKTNNFVGKLQMSKVLQGVLNTIFMNFFGKMERVTFISSQKLKCFGGCYGCF